MDNRFTFSKHLMIHLDLLGAHQHDEGAPKVPAGPPCGAPRWPRSASCWRRTARSCRSRSPTRPHGPLTLRDAHARPYSRPRRPLVPHGDRAGHHHICCLVASQQLLALSTVHDRVDVGAWPRGRPRAAQCSTCRPRRACDACPPLISSGRTSFCRRWWRIVARGCAHFLAVA